MKKSSKKLISILAAFFMVIGLSSKISLSVKADSIEEYSKISAGDNVSLVINNDGSLWGWGDYGSKLLGGNIIPLNVSVKIMDGVKSISIGWNYALAIKNDNSLWAWGSNNCGQFGDGTTKDSVTPVKVMDGVKAISAGDTYVLAVKIDGSLWAWGRAKLGDGTTEDSPIPLKIMDEVKAIATGSTHSLALKKDGSLWAWGNNGYGQLGDGTTKGSVTPIEVMDEVTAIGNSEFYSLALKKDGSLWAWGANDGQLGDGTTENRLTPVKTMDGVKAISTRGNHSLAIKTDGSLWSWGYSAGGQVGDGTTVYFRKTPVKIMDEVNDISAGKNHSLAIKTDGSLWGWGTDIFKPGAETRTDDYTKPSKLMDSLSFKKLTNSTSNSVSVQQTIVVNNGSSLDLNKYLNLNGANVIWKSSNTNVTTVSNGVVTAVGIGNSTINAVGQDGIQYGTFTINVTTNDVNKGDLNTIRLGGKDRYETSAVISQTGWKNGSTYVVLANGDNYPDALGAAPLAKKYNAPILLTGANSIPESILNEIKRLNVNHIFICGGTAVVSKDVESQLNAMGITTERLGGKDRYETSVLIAKKLGVVSGEVMTTNGYEWSDALSASSIAAKKGVPIILTDKDVLPDSTSSFLNATNFSKTYILGNTDLVSDNVVNKFPSAERIVGSNEYERNINIIKRFQSDIDFSNICIASGKNFPDALSGSALATMVSSAIVLVDNSELQSITTQYTSQNLMQVNNVYVFGLQGSVNDDIVKKLFNK